MSLIYSAGIALIATCSVFRRKSRPSFAKKWGKELLAIERPEGPFFWIHAVSLGETRAIAPLVKQLKAENSAVSILVTSGTLTGHQEAKKLLQEANWHFFLPYDFASIYKKIGCKLKPTLLLLSETDFWHHLQTSVKKNGGKVALINGKISERSTRKLSFFKPLSHLLFGSVDLFCVQGASYEERFKKLGVSPSKIIVTGNLKFEGIETPDVKEEWRQKLVLHPSDLLLTCGSTHNPEEAIFIKVFKELQIPHLKLLIVPRHPERFAEVAKLLETEKVSFGRFCKGDTFKTAPVLLMDQMGLLRQCYQVSHIAFVGGTFAPKVGGHNIFEPSCYKVPVIYGPYLFSQPDFTTLMKQYQAGIEITENTVVSTLKKLIDSPDLRSNLGKNGYLLINESKGALGRTTKALKDLLSIDVKSINP